MLEEFSQQAHLEKVKGVPVTTFMVFSNESSKMNTQSFFITTFVLPLWKSLYAVYPDNFILERVKSCEENLKFYQSQYEVELRKELWKNAENEGMFR